MKRLWLLLPLLLLAAPVRAQMPASHNMPASAPAPAPPPAGGNVAVDPIRCWWQSAKGSVRVGEIFNVTLTCAVLENDAVKVLPDEKNLTASAIQLAPFEVLGGSHPSDLYSGARRFFQYQYQVRLINADAIGKDIGLPGVPIHYAINSTVTTNSSVQGRDLVYVMPMIPIRIASLVPTDATDIRDATGEDFANVDTYTFRANVLDIAATTAVALGVLLIVLVVVGLARRVRSRIPVGERVLTTRALLDAASKELGSVAREREAAGWTPALASRALAATRISAAAAIDGNISQRLSSSSTSVSEGAVVASGGFRGKARTISGSTTPADVDRAIKRATGEAAARGPLLESLRDALAGFGAANYSREAALDASTLDSALASAQSATQQVRAEHSWLKTTIRQWRAGAQAPATSRA